MICRYGHVLIHSAHTSFLPVELNLWSTYSEIQMPAGSKGEAAAAVAVVKEEKGPTHEALLAHKNQHIKEGLWFVRRCHVVVPLTEDQQFCFTVQQLNRGGIRVRGVNRRPAAQIKTLRSGQTASHRFSFDPGNTETLTKGRLGL